MTGLQLDGSKIHHHMEALARWKRGEKIYPLLVEISPTNGCNHACLFCAYDYIHRDNTFLNADRLIEIYAELRALGTKSLFYSGEGEPLLHKRIGDIMKAAAELGFDQALNTNATALKGKLMERILPHMTFVRVSLNGVTAADYGRVHVVPETHFEMVMTNIKAAVDLKYRLGLQTTIGVQCVYLNQPIEDLVDQARRVRDLGVDYYSVKQFNPHPENPFALDLPTPPAADFAPVLEVATEDFHVHGRLGLMDPASAKRPYKQCLSLPFFAEIVANGEVYTCGPHLGEKDFCYGNIHDMDFTTLWSDANRDKVEAYIRRIDDLDHVCMPNCRLDGINRALWDLQNPPDHVNFI